MVPCFQLKNAQKEGFMQKLGGSGLTPRNWRRRWFVLKDKKLYYYKTAFVSSFFVLLCVSEDWSDVLSFSLLQDVSALGIVDMVGYTIEHSSDPKKKQ